jgi:hypothetical protein
MGGVAPASALSSVLLPLSSFNSFNNDLEAYKAQQAAIQQQNQLLALQSQQRQLKQLRDENQIKKQLNRNLSRRNNINHAFGLDGNSGSARQIAQSYITDANNALSLQQQDNLLAQAQLDRRQKPKKRFDILSRILR